MFVSGMLIKKRLTVIAIAFSENKLLKQQQTKKSMEDSKNIQSDKTIKTKAEKDRRVKEIQDKNVKVFVEERKRLVVKHQRHVEQLNKCHAEQKELLEKEARKVCCFFETRLVTFSQLKH